MDAADRASRRGIALTAAVLVAACTGAPTASPTSPVAATPGSNATPAPITSSTATPVVVPVETSLPTATPATVAGNWRAVLNQEAVSGAQFQDVVWTGTRFVASGHALASDGGVLVSSVDGRTWRSISSGGSTGYPARLAAGPNGVVAVGTIDSRSAAWHSTDGIHWTWRLAVFPAALGDDDVVAVTDVVAAGSGWLAVGRDDPTCEYNCGLDPRRALAWTSSDAKEWTQVDAQASFLGAGINAVTAFGDGYVAVGQAAGHAAIWTSADGLTWARVPDDPMFGPPVRSGSQASVRAVGVAAGKGSIVAVGMGFDIGAGGAPAVMAWRSVDGRTWTRSTVEGAEEGQVFSVAATNGGFLATGPSGATSCLGGIWSSNDGAAWRCVATDVGFAGFGPYAAASSPSVDVAVGLTDVGWDPNGALGLPGAIWWRPA